MIICRSVRSAYVQENALHALIGPYLRSVSAYPDILAGLPHCLDRLL